MNVDMIFGAFMGALLMGFIAMYLHSNCVHKYRARLRDRDEDIRTLAHKLNARTNEATRLRAVLRDTRDAVNELVPYDGPLEVRIEPAPHGAAPEDVKEQINVDPRNTRKTR